MDSWASFREGGGAVPEDLILGDQSLQHFQLVRACLCVLKNQVGCPENVLAEAPRSEEAAPVFIGGVPAPVPLKISSYGQSSCWLYDNDNNSRCSSWDFRSFRICPDQQRGSKISPKASTKNVGNLYI